MNEKTLGHSTRPLLLAELESFQFRARHGANWNSASASSTRVTFDIWTPSGVETCESAWTRRASLSQRPEAPAGDHRRARQTDSRSRAFSSPIPITRRHGFLDLRGGAPPRGDRPRARGRRGWADSKTDHQLPAKARQERTRRPDFSRPGTSAATPARAIISASYNEKFSWDFGREVRQIIEDSAYRQIFPAVQIHTATVDRIETESGSKLFFTGRGG